MSTRSSRSSFPIACLSDPPRLGMDAESLATDFKKHYGITLARDKHCQSIHYAYTAIALTVRDRLMERWKDTNQTYDEAGCRQAYYLSMEFLMGRAFGNAVLNLGIDNEIAKVLHEQSLIHEDLADAEHDAGLGNGGLGRLAACFIDSCATMQLPVRGYGIRYEYGMFRQHIENGYQVEEPDHWLREGYVWELERPELTQRVHFGGHTEFYPGLNGEMRVRWIGTHDVLAVPYDNPIPGYRNGTVNTLRLWKSAATDEFDLGEFNAGSYPESVAQKNGAEHISMVLYPNDASENGKELRLKQQYFLASASLQDVIRTWIEGSNGHNFSDFASRNCFQLNDTHPSIAVAELMRLLMDEHGLGWDQAWKITSSTMAYTNHTLLPEALERWPVRLFRQLLPRLLEIIYEINARFIAEVARRWPGDNDKLAAMSLIEEGEEQQVRMAYLAIVGSFSVNGVAGLHSRLLQEGLFKDFYALWPHKFNNKTNGITPRRWILNCNPNLSALISEAIGDGWICDLSQLRKLAPFADDPEFRSQWRTIKQQNKQRLLEFKRSELGIEVSIDALFDVQVKRIHEYKRQLLNVLHVIHLYDRIKRGDKADWVARCVLIGGKAAPGYAMAKLIIKLVNNVANVINQDPDTKDLLKLCFLPNYRVSAMEIICPAADLSEQISTAGKEASGTGNMKFMVNGALTIGTLDGANIEIREEVGEENFFLFGMTAEEVEIRRSNYRPNLIIEQDADLRRVMKLIECGHFSQFEPDIFRDLVRAVRSEHDPWMTAADFRSFVDTQKLISQTFTDTEKWTRMSILNCAASGKFSSDRTIAEYNREIWKLDSVSPNPLNP